MRNVRHYEFTTALREKINRTPTGSWRIALRLDGEDHDANIALLRDGKLEQLWLVGTKGGTVRSDTWNIYSWMGQALPGMDAPQIYDVYERGINQHRQGWVVLFVRDGKPVSANWWVRFAEATNRAICALQIAR